MSDLLQQMASASTARDEALATLRVTEERAQQSRAAQTQAEEALSVARAAHEKQTSELQTKVCEG